MRHSRALQLLLGGLKTTHYKELVMISPFLLIINLYALYLLCYVDMLPMQIAIEK